MGVIVKPKAPGKRTSCPAFLVFEYGTKDITVYFKESPMNEAGRRSAGKLPVNSPDIKITICEGHVAVIERLDLIEAPTRAALRQQLEYTNCAFSF